MLRPLQILKVNEMKLFVFSVLIVSLMSCVSLNKASISLVQIELLAVELRKAFPDYKGKEDIRDMFELTISSDKDLFELARNNGTTMVLRNTLEVCQSDNTDSLSFPGVYIKKGQSEYQEYLTDDRHNTFPDEFKILVNKREFVEITSNYADGEKICLKVSAGNYFSYFSTNELEFELGKFRNLL